MCGALRRLGDVGQREPTLRNGVILNTRSYSLLLWYFLCLVIRDTMIVTWMRVLHPTVHAHSTGNTTQLKVCKDHDV